MTAFLNHWAVWLLISVQVVGLLSTWLARASEGLSLQRRFQWIFLTCLCLVGGSMMIGLSLGTGFRLTTGATLSVMLVTAIFDAGEPRDAIVW